MDGSSMDRPTSGSAAAYAHDAPPMRVPMSGLAITAFILSLVFVCFSLAGLWWLNGVALLLAVFAWPAISAGRRRGGGFAIAASCIAVLCGLGSLLVWRGIADGMEQMSSGLMSTLEKDDHDSREKLKGWVAPGEDPEAAITRWKAKIEHIHAEVGAYGDRTIVRSGMWGFGPLFTALAPPNDVEELDGGGTPTPIFGQALWFQASFAKGILWVAIEFDQAHKSGETSAEVKMRAEKGQYPMVKNLRFFRSK
jgi:hypothetical protein